MRSDLWCFLLFCFHIEVLSGKNKDSNNPEMFSYQNGDLNISCQYPETVQQFKMELVKGKEVLCDLIKTKRDGNTVSENLKSCPSQLSTNSVTFLLHNFDSGYYFCNLSIFDPPPVRENILAREYLHAYESQVCCQLKFWLPIGCAAFAVVYIFGCILTFWFTKKKYKSIVHDPNSEYMFMAAINTAKKPRFAGVTS